MRSMYVVVFMTIVPFLSACTGGEDFSKRLSREVKKGAGTTVTFSALTDFPWDVVYVYGPYHPLEEINSKHGTRLKGEYDFGHVPEGDCLYVFENRGEVAKTVYYPRYKGSCEELLHPGRFTPENAVFEVAVQAPGSHPSLKWAEPASALPEMPQEARRP